jgi:hypothetical protein
LAIYSTPDKPKNKLFLVVPKEKIMALITEKQGITAKRPTGLLPTHPKKGPPLPRLLKVKWPETPPEKVPAKILVKMISGVRRMGSGITDMAAVLHKSTSQ